MPTKKLLFFTSIIGLFALSIAMQSTLLLNWDVSWLMRASARLLKGGSYTHDFFEINPPLILYLYIPPVLLAKLTTLSIITALRIYVFALIALSLFICHRIAQNIFPQQKNFERVFIVILAAIYLILPVYEFGQREHLTLLMIMPYLLAMAARAQQQRISLPLIIMTGILAGVGFAIKPHFFLVPVLVELYYLYRTKNPFSWLRIDTALIFSIASLYVASVIIWHPDYLNTVVPVVLRFYDNGFHVQTSALIFQTELLPIWIAIALFFIQYKKEDEKPLEIILFIALIGFTIAYFWQSRIWYYHLLPSLAAALLLITLLLPALFAHHDHKKRDRLFLPLFSLFIFLMPLYTTLECLAWSYHYKKSVTPLIDYLKQNAAQKSFLIFASTTIYAYPAADYAHTDNPSRFGFFGWIPGMLNRHDAKAATDKTFFINMTVDDFALKKPDLVLVDVSKNKSYIKKDQFNYLTYFSENEKFRALWKNYHYVTTLENEDFYTFDVYQKNSGLL